MDAQKNNQTKSITVAGYPIEYLMRNGLGMVQASNFVRKFKNEKDEMERALRLAIRKSRVLKIPLEKCLCEPT